MNCSRNSTTSAHHAKTVDKQWRVTLTRKSYSGKTKSSAESSRNRSSIMILSCKTLKFWAEVEDELNSNGGWRLWAVYFMVTDVILGGNCNQAPKAREKCWYVLNSSYSKNEFSKLCSSLDFLWWFRFLRSGAPPPELACYVKHSFTCGRPNLLGEIWGFQIGKSPKSSVLMLFDTVSSSFLSSEGVRVVRSGWIAAINIQRAALIYLLWDYNRSRSIGSTLGGAFCVFLNASDARSSSHSS